MLLITFRFEIEVTDYLLLKAADLEKKIEDLETDLLADVKKENRNEEEELKKVIFSLRY